MADEKNIDLLSRKMQETKNDLRSKTLNVAYEIAEIVQEMSKVQLTFNQFNTIFEKIKGIANEGYTSALMLLFCAGNEL